MVAVDTDGPGPQLNHKIVGKDKNHYSVSERTCESVPPNMIYHQKAARKNSTASYSSVEIHRMRNQDPNL